jgi:hypothetical protein
MNVSGRRRRIAPAQQKAAGARPAAFIPENQDQYGQELSDM